jgi:hypothetical protein
LSDNGYLDAADVNGVWTPAIAAGVLQSHVGSCEQQQTHSGGFSIGTPSPRSSPPLDSRAAGAAHALPGELRDLVSEIAGDVGATAYDIGHPVGFIPGTGTAHKASRVRFARCGEGRVGSR